MKNFFVYFLILFIVSCNNKTSQNEKVADSTISSSEAKVESNKEDLKLKSYLDKFVEYNKDCFRNKITEQDCADILKNNFLRDNFQDNIDPITEIPVIFKMSMKYNDNKYVVKFEYNKESTNFRISRDYDVIFQVFSIVDKNTAKELSDGCLYYISGTCNSFANKESFTLPSGSYFEGYPKIDEIDRRMLIDLGTLIVTNLSFTETKKSEIPNI